MTTTLARRGAGLRAAVLLLAFGLAVGLRVAVGGVGVAQSPTAGLVFAACLLGLAAAAGTSVPVSRAALRTGLLGGLLICLPAVLAHLDSPLHGTTGFLPWVAVVTVVATSEEVFLRGTAYDAVADLAGTGWATGVGAVAFALLHVPLYGWHVLPLDLAVGVVLGLLRTESGTPSAPAVAHVLADVVGWFVR